jgi:hypothetical protein
MSTDLETWKNANAAVVAAEADLLATQREADRIGYEHEQEIERRKRAVEIARAELAAMPAPEPDELAAMPAPEPDEPATKAER